MIVKDNNGLYEALKSDILRGKFAPGSKLKIETLKRLYGMGVNVIRESLARLAAEDLVDSEGQKGFRVAETTPGRLSDLTRMRILLETDGVKHSMEKGDIDWETGIVAALQKLVYIEQKMRDDEQAHLKIWQQYDWEFHSALIDACDSHLHRLYHRRVLDQFRQYVVVDLKTTGFRGSDIMKEHKAIADAAINRDYERCAKALETHLNFYLLHHKSEDQEK